MPFWSSSASPSATAPSSTSPSKETGAYEAPDRSKRAKCWDSRDAYFGCLDRNNILDALKDSEQASKACGKEEVGFERDCVASWVKYFKQRRVAEYEKEQLLKRQEAETMGRR